MLGTEYFPSSGKILQDTGIEERCAGSTMAE